MSFMYIRSHDASLQTYKFIEMLVKCDSHWSVLKGFDLFCRSLILEVMVMGWTMMMMMMQMLLLLLMMKVCLDEDYWNAVKK